MGVVMFYADSSGCSESLDWCSAGLWRVLLCRGRCSRGRCGVGCNVLGNIKARVGSLACATRKLARMLSGQKSLYLNVNRASSRRRQPNTSDPLQFRIMASLRLLVPRASLSLHSRQLQKRLVGSSLRHASTTPPPPPKPRVLEKPERFNPPSHPSRRIRPRQYPGPPLSEHERQAQKVRRYPHMMPPEGSFMHWFLTNRVLHTWITLVRTIAPKQSSAMRTEHTI